MVRTGEMDDTLYLSQMARKWILAYECTDVGCRVDWIGPDKTIDGHNEL